MDLQVREEILCLGGTRYRCTRCDWGSLVTASDEGEAAIARLDLWLMGREGWLLRYGHLWNAMMVRNTGGARCLGAEANQVGR